MIAPHPQSLGARTLRAHGAEAPFIEVQEFEAAGPQPAFPEPQDPGTDRGLYFLVLVITTALSMASGMAIGFFLNEWGPALLQGGE